MTPPSVFLSIDAAAYSPSVYDTPKKVTSKASESSLFQKSESQQVQPDLPDTQDFMAARRTPPPALPARSRARDDQREHRNHITYDEAQYLAGVTSHGGSLENNNNWTADQILRQVESTADLARLINSRTATQAEELPALVMNTRAQIKLVRQEARQAEERITFFVQQEITKLKADLSELVLVTPASTQNPYTHDWRASTAYNSHQAVQAGFKPPRDNDRRVQNQNKRKSKQLPMKCDESTHSKADIKKPAAEPPQETKVGSVAQTEHSTEKLLEEQGPSNDVATPTAAFRTPNPLIDDAATPVPTNRSVQKNPGEETSGSPKSKAAKLRISSPQPIADPNAALEGMQKNGLENNRVPPALQRESENQPRNDASNEDIKAPKKKGALFSFGRKGDGDSQSRTRFLRTPRTPRRTKDGKTPGSQESQSPCLAISTPTRAQTGNLASPDTSSTSATVALAGAQINRCESPSSVHPALRTPQQRQIMLERERRFAALKRHIAHNQYQAQAQAHAHAHHHSLRVSHSHQNFHTGSTSPGQAAPSFISYEAPNPRYASGLSTSSSASSFRGLTHYNPGLHYHHPSSCSLPVHGQAQGLYHAPQPILPYPPLPDPGFSTPLGHGHGSSHGSPGQFDGADRNGNGTNNDGGNPFI
ncbi:hypothetical protein BJX70DRAFT_283158 [Aspergillus crustosus]